MHKPDETTASIFRSMGHPMNGLWLTTADQKCLFEKQPFILQFTNTPSLNSATIHIDPNQTYQTMDGFGFSLTGGSAYVLSGLDDITRNKLLVELFSPQKQGIGISFLRLSIGASDLSQEPYSYDDAPDGQADLELLHFNLLKGDSEVIPILQQILAINPSIKIIATPWSAPPWMKTNHSFIGGSLKPEYQSVYAKYFVKYIQAMNEYGIAIHAITPQNEPLNDANEPSMLMDAIEQATFIKHHLGPAFRSAGLATKIFCWDHNCDRPDYPMTIYADNQAGNFVAGSAWHLYAGGIDALSKIHDAYPVKQIYFTEQWVGSEGQFAGDLLWHGRNVLIGSTMNWSSVVLEWNLASDPNCCPHTVGGAPNCVGALTIGDTIQRNVAYYIIAHMSKFVRPGSVRIYSQTDCGLAIVAFKTPDHSFVLVVLNDSDVNMDFNIQIQQKIASCNIPALSLGTYIWQSL